MADALLRLPCPDCRRPPILHVPVEFEQQGLAYLARFDLELVPLAIAVHRKQHRGA